MPFFPKNIVGFAKKATWAHIFEIGNHNHNSLVGDGRVTEKYQLFPFEGRNISSPAFGIALG